MASDPGSPLAAHQPCDAFARLTPFGWGGGLVFIHIALLLSFFLLGYFVIYWRNADMDFMVVYNALAMNDGLPQSYFDHPGYLTILSVKYWFQLLHTLGLLEASRLSAIPAAADVPAFDAAMTGAIRAGRVAALLIALGSLITFTVLIRKIVSDWRVAMLAVFAFAFSGGFAVHMRILRTEMIAASALVTAFLLLVIAGQRATRWRPLWVGIAAMLCVLSLENKVQTIVLIAALPVLLLPFGGTDSASVGFWRNTGSASAATAMIAAAAGLSLWLAYQILAAGFDPTNVANVGLRPALGGMLGAYQIALLVWIGLWMLAYAVIWNVAALETLAAMLAIAAGCALPLLVLLLSFHINNVVAVVNPLERLLSFGMIDEPVATGHGVGRLAALALEQIGPLLKRYTFFLYTSPRPAIFLIWLIVPGIIYAWRRGERQTACQAALLLLAVFAIDAIGIRRGLKAEYFIFTDPFIIIAGALLLDRLSDLRWRRWAYPFGAGLLLLHVAVGESEPVKQAMRRSGPDYICQFNTAYLPKLPLPWCGGPAIRS